VRRRVRPGVVTDPAEGVFWWERYPPTDDDDAFAAWFVAFDAWCDEHEVDHIAVTVEADRRGLTDIPFDPGSL
jgi:hypothetical protein